MKTLEELVAAFNAQRGSTGGEEAPEPDVVHQLKAVVLAAADVAEKDGVVSLAQYRLRLESALRKSIRAAVRAGQIPEELARFTYAERDRIESLADRLAEDGFELLKKEA